MPDIGEMIMTSSKDIANEMPEYYREKKRQMLLDNIIRRESAANALQDESLANQAVVQTKSLTETQKSDLLGAINTGSASPLGRLLAAGIAGIAAPVILGYVGGNTSDLAKIMSIPIGAYGGMSLYDYIFGPDVIFSPTVPTNKNILFAPHKWV